MTENEIGEKVIGCALTVHRALGPGLLEDAYEACLAHELTKAGLQHDRQLALPVLYDGTRIDLGYRIDLMVCGLVIVELKAVDEISDVHRAQLLSYLKFSERKLGYLINFNVKMLRDGVTRMANGL